jgi:hypothetical protein
MDKWRMPGVSFFKSESIMPIFRLLLVLFRQAADAPAN